MLSNHGTLKQVKDLAGREQVQAALDRYRTEIDSILEHVISVQQIPAPTFSEGERAAFVEEQFKRVGLEEVHQDNLHNVFGCLPGRKTDAPLVVSAHSDTVFAQDVDLSIERSDGRLAGPGIADNSLGVAGLILLAETCCGFEARPARDIWFVSNVGEEGLGNLRGMRAVVDRFGEAAGYVVLEGGLYGYVCHEAVGVRRYRLQVETPGGHSWGAFGAPSAIHVLGRLIADIDALEVPHTPKTTYNVGVVEGGTTVNSIARSASLLLDLRSEETAALSDLVSQIEALVVAVGEMEEVTVAMEEIGSRPAGRVSRRAALVQAAVAALEVVGCEKVTYTIGSTDANIPLSRGYPAVCIGLTRSANTHRPDEYMEIDPVPAGLGQALLLLLTAAGMFL